MPIPPFSSFIFSTLNRSLTVEQWQCGLSLSSSLFFCLNQTRKDEKKSGLLLVRIILFDFAVQSFPAETRLNYKYSGGTGERGWGGEGFQCQNGLASIFWLNLIYFPSFLFYSYIFFIVFRSYLGFRGLCACVCVVLLMLLMPVTVTQRFYVAPWFPNIYKPLTTHTSNVLEIDISPKTPYLPSCIGHWQ